MSTRRIFFFFFFASLFLGGWLCQCIELIVTIILITFFLNTDYNWPAYWTSFGASCCLWRLWVDWMECWTQGKTVLSVAIVIYFPRSHHFVLIKLEASFPFRHESCYYYPIILFPWYLVFLKWCSTWWRQNYLVVIVAFFVALVTGLSTFGLWFIWRRRQQTVNAYKPVDEVIPEQELQPLNF